MFKKLFHNLVKLIGYLAVGGLTIIAISRLITGISGWTRIVDIAETPPKPVAIIFGAGLTYTGAPTAVLRDRIETGVQLYFDGKVQKLLMSGDNSTVHYNEPAAMRAYAISLGVPDEAIVLDYAGQRTYDTCYRAKAIFGVESAVLVTQAFHLPRALYLCNALGVDAVGVEADKRTYRRISQFFWNVRELGATVAALLDVHVLRPLPILGEPEPIFEIRAQ
jgi:SanA protein